MATPEQHSAPVAPRLAMVAGEASGDLLASLVLDGMRARWPQLQASGIGGPQMIERGFQAIWPSEKLAVHGYSLEVFKRVRELLGIRKQLRERLLQERPSVFIGVDAPDFNLGLESALKAGGVRTVHFVCPSIWAWRPERVHKIRQSTDHVLCIFPFEPALLAQNGIAATYVGHPLASVIPMEPDQAAARAQLGLRLDAPVVALLPGSRGGEVRYLAPRFIEAAKLMQQARPTLQVVLPAVPHQRAAIEAQVAAAGMTGRIQVLAGQSHTVFAACDVTLIASGTATLEAALFKRPMVVSYAMHPISAWLMRRKQLQPWISLPNILCRDFVVPEVLQEAATPQALANEVMQWLDDRASGSARITALDEKFRALHLELRRDTAQLATDAIQKIINT